MNTRRLVTILFCSCLCLASLSCQRGRPARKELPPSLSSLPEIGATVTPFPSRWSSLAPQPSSNVLFYCTDTTLLTDGIRHDFLVLAIPDPSRDSTIGSLISTGQSLAPYLLTQLHNQNKAGIVFDLRLSPGSPVIRQDYLVNSSALNETNLPVVFLSDQYSSGRAAFYAQYLEQFPGITWTIANGRPRNQADCFKDVHPSF
jgi:hypothetical protein